MTNVIPLKPKADPMIWTCGECGCQTFYLYSSGSTECALCGLHDDQPRGRWRDNLEDDETVPDDMPVRTDIVHGSDEFARKSVMKSAGDDSAAVVVLQKNGGIRLWSVVGKDATDEQKQWLRHMLTAATALAFGERSDTDEIPD